MRKVEPRETVAIVGAGNVGSTLAMRVVESGLADVVLLDVYRSIAEGKALDIVDTFGITGGSRRIFGTDEYSNIKGSRIVVITAGFPRKPGMSREDLASKNAAIVKDVAGHIKAHAPDAVVVVVTNPLDAMTYLAYRAGSFPRTKVMGMAGLLDESRFIALIAHELKVSARDVKTVMMGSHGDTMVPILSHTKVGRRPLTEILPKERIDELVRITRSRGAQIVGLLGSGSAYYSPSLAAFKMVECVLRDRREILTASAYLQGEYGLADLCIGVPLRVGGNGIESVIEIDLNEEEKVSLRESAKTIRETIESLPFEQ
jgi:malate dehydrogenase